MAARFARRQRGGGVWGSREGGRGVVPPPPPYWRCLHTTIDFCIGFVLELNLKVKYYSQRREKYDSLLKKEILSASHLKIILWLIYGDLSVKNKNITKVNVSRVEFRHTLTSDLIYKLEKRKNTKEYDSYDSDWNAINSSPTLYLFHFCFVSFPCYNRYKKITVRYLFGKVAKQIFLKHTSKFLENNSLLWRHIII